MRLTQTRTRQLCRLLVATWCLVFAFGVLLGCQEQATDAQDPVAVHAQAAPSLIGHAGAHDASQSPLCEQTCQALSSQLAKADVSVALPLLSTVLLVWFLLPPVLWLALAIAPHLLSPPATGGTPPRPHLLFQRFNN
ncbi:hypothetical protein [Vogesella indigofera]|uniref:hypothetical protein n=1 Tax=Vogesella indigofera TaxID=45465 RepID=UPI00234E3A86|nr:hypothetical protein [Vogesella indigofera]MDC7696679.1 hypothetical protein [Vogesella indigofera]